MIRPYLDYGDISYMGGSQTTNAQKICQNVENRYPTSNLHKQTKSAAILATRIESDLKVMALTYNRATKYISKATRDTRRNDVPVITNSRPTVASYNRSVQSIAAHIWNEQPSKTRNIKSIEAYKTKHIYKTKQPTPPNN